MFCGPATVMPGFPVQQGFPGQMQVVPQRAAAPQMNFPAARSAPQAAPQAAPLQLAAEPRPKVRLQAPEETAPPRQRLALPPPEQYGIGTNPPATAAVPTSTPRPADAPTASAQVDWNVAKQRLERLGVVAFHSDRLGHSGFRISVLLPTAAGSHHVEAEAASEAL